MDKKFGTRLTEDLNILNDWEHTVNKYRKSIWTKGDEGVGVLLVHGEEAYQLVYYESYSKDLEPDVKHEYRLKHDISYELRTFIKNNTE